VIARRLSLPNGRVWLRVASPAWRDPLDPLPARERGGRWNPPDSFPTLYFNGDVTTARQQVARLLEGSPVTMEDLDDGAYVLVAAFLPRMQHVADAVTDTGLTALGLPPAYPRDAGGREIGHEICQPVGRAIRGQHLRGIWCRSASTADGSGRELAWFPATSRSTATPLWRRPLPLGAWRSAVSWDDIGFAEQRDPA
jgi:hypothetical protein